MKLVCIDDSENQAHLFFGRWIEFGKEYDGQLVQSPCDKAALVVIDGVPGKKMRREFCKCGNCVYGFKPSRFVQAEANCYRDEALLASFV